ncbi:MAG: T9SS C-terminal target domain-containing protein [Candidatus Zixiibacteriota bacterium]|nr:MAG: T9SS C-terminal target domain-containing protein [candidate division Zixibacteria bacterium]
MRLPAMLAAAGLLLLSGVMTAQALEPIEDLGKLIYFDTNLSVPAGQSCATCHHPTAGFADPNHSLPVSQGAIQNRFGNRSAPTSAYCGYAPAFHWDPVEEMYLGGQFWDGREDDLVGQAKGPFLNPLEMNNPSKRHVIQKIRRSSYAAMFEEVFGVGILRQPEAAYDSAAVAIAAYEMTNELNAFTSKYDYYLQGLAQLTTQEALGLQLFNDENAGNCAACHPSTPGPYYTQALFTDYSYDNLGLPKNWDSPFLTLPPAFNPMGMNYIDKGLGDRLEEEDEWGKFKVPTLRNVAVTSPYGHNGIFETLTDIVNFYNTRDVPGAGWDPPEVPENVNDDELGDLGLNADQVAAIVAFMMTLTDGYIVTAGEEVTPVLAAMPQRHALGASPNPFNPVTTLSYQLTAISRVSLRVYDTAGREVAALVDGWREAGAHQVTFDASGLPSGIYFARLSAGDVAQTQKLVLMK